MDQEALALSVNTSPFHHGVIIHTEDISFVKTIGSDHCGGAISNIYYASRALLDIPVSLILRAPLYMTRSFSKVPLITKKLGQLYIRWTCISHCVELLESSICSFANRKGVYRYGTVPHSRLMPLSSRNSSRIGRGGSV